jgi:hypothetical protein
VAATASPAVQQSRDVLAVLRPDGLELVPPGSPDSWPGVVTSRRFAGASFAFRVKVESGVELEVHGTDRSVHEGDRVAVTISREPVAVV